MNNPTTPIQFIDLKAQYDPIRFEIAQAISRVLETRQYILGEEVAGFEREFAQYCGSRQAIAVNSGTSALHLALLAAGIGQGDEVITVPFTFVATVAAIRYTGARPIYVDIEEKGYGMDPASLEKAITAKTKAILPVHIYGQCVDMDPILEIARKRGIPVIEDAAQAHGATYHGKRVGSIGDFGCFSFYPGKNLGAYGEGGLVTTDSDEAAKKIRMLRDWGQAEKYYHELAGFNYRMEGLQGAILRVKLKYLEAWTESRRRNANLYHSLLTDIGVDHPQEIPGRRHVYHIYALRFQNREKAQNHFSRLGIHTGIHYPVPVHLQKAYLDSAFNRGDFPISEAISSETLSMPMYPELSEDSIHRVVDAVRDYYGSNS